MLAFFKSVDFSFDILAASFIDIAYMSLCTTYVMCARTDNVLFHLVFSAVCAGWRGR